MRDILRRPEKGSENKIPKNKGSEGTKAENIHDVVTFFYCSSNFQYFLFIVKNRVQFKTYGPRSHF